MDQIHKPVIASPNVLVQALRTLRLVWRLFQDPRVNILPKLIPVAALIYIISPIDLLPDFILGLGQLDDLGIFLLAVALFIQACPKEIVAEHRRSLSEGGHISHPYEYVIDGSYRVISDDEPPLHTPHER